MNNTAINQGENMNYLLSRYADANISTSSKPDSLANVLANGFMTLQPYSVVAPLPSGQTPPVSTEDPLMLDKTDFDHLVDVITNPPKPSFELRNLLEGND